MSTTEVAPHVNGSSFDRPTPIPELSTGTLAIQPLGMLCHCGKSLNHRGRHVGSPSTRKPKRENSVKNATEMVATPMQQTGNSLTLKLQCGARLNVTLEGNWFYLTENDRRVVFGILDRAKQLGA